MQNHMKKIFVVLLVIALSASMIKYLNYNKNHVFIKILKEKQHNKTDDKADLSQEKIEETMYLIGKKTAELSNVSNINSPAIYVNNQPITLLKIKTIRSCTKLS